MREMAPPPGAEVSRSTWELAGFTITLSVEGVGARDLLGLWSASGREINLLHDVADTVALLGPASSPGLPAPSSEEGRGVDQREQAGTAPERSEAAVAEAGAATASLHAAPLQLVVPAFVEEYRVRTDVGRIPAWRLHRAAFAGRAARAVLLGQRRTPLPTPEPEAALPAPTVWVVLRACEAGGEGIYTSWRQAAVQVSADGLMPKRSAARSSEEQVFAQRALFYSWASQAELSHFMWAAAGRRY